MTDDFCYLLRVRYAECDAQKVVFNGRYVDYVDVAVTEFTRALWGDYAELLKKGIDNQVVAIKLDWQAPAHFDEVLAVRVSVLRIGVSSYTLKVQFFHYASNKPLAQCEITYVVIDAERFEKMPIPEDLRASLQHGAMGVTVDHAGIG